MKIALIFNKEVPYTTGTYIERVFKQEGINFQHFWTSRAHTIKPEFDLYLRIDHGDYKYDIPKKLRPCAFWAIDAHLKKPFKKILKQSRHYDFVFCAQKNGAGALHKRSINSFWLPLGCDPEIHQKLELQKRFNLGFVGTPFYGETRGNLLKLIKERYPESSLGTAEFSEMRNIYSQSKIGFNYSINNDINMRIFEIMSCGTMLITNYIKDNGLIELFEDRRHLVIYKNQDELCDLIEYYLKHEDERNRIAQAGYELVRSKYTYSDRVKKMFTMIYNNLNTRYNNLRVNMAPIIAKRIQSKATQQVKMEYVNCNLCDSDKTELLFVSKDMLLNKPGQFLIVRCKNCGLIYLNPRPTKQSLQQYYPTQYYSYQPPGNKKRGRLEKFFLELNKKTKNQILQEYFNYGKRPLSQLEKALSILKKIVFFAPYLRLVLLGKDIKIIPYQGEGRILDIGCGNGRALSLLKERGWDTYGVEVNSQAVDIARDKLNLKVQLGNISDVEFQNNFFDVVIMTHSLEHMANPKEILRKVNRILKVGGTLIVTIPNADSFEARYFRQFWIGWDPPRHLYTFSLKTLKKMLQTIGSFKIKRVKYELGTYVLRESLRYRLRERSNYNLRDSRLLESILKSISLSLGYLHKSGIITVYITKTEDIA